VASDAAQCPEAAMSKGVPMPISPSGAAHNDAAPGSGNESSSSKQGHSDTIVEQLGNSCRMIQSFVKDASGKKLLTRLEILRGHDWVPVLSYEISILCLSAANLAPMVITPLYLSTFPRRRLKNWLSTTCGRTGEIIAMNNLESFLNNNLSAG